ncbi:xanthine dehydrogenase accessory protein XdhC [Pseudoduganella violacea]|uniref:Xanthine dehydrogenase accessory factor n=1 Tax=Pseudoduganella violacea TaxID=1715466 RepID=A0A7W5BAE4_9BURK|nr:xanthine dehydrogenase accessory protein XdhC [Pseudoduganella violacea]MBB3119291.1 xanthine dehydrogenase accessory factor [Pseudoduganella violacea]
MNDWLTAATVPAVLVTVAKVEGSAPRESGTKMLVTAATQFDTIGGGHLELRAVDMARAMLCAATPPAVQYKRFPLGPSLGQCCGGVVWLSFEPVQGALAVVLDALRQRRNEDSWRLSAIDGAPACALFDASSKLLAGETGPGFPAFARERGAGEADARVFADDSGRRWLVDAVLAPRAHLVLFGAGHVGAAIVRALGELPCRVTWVDEREEMFPADLPPNVTVEATDAPEALVAAAPPGSSYLVMTHSHPLDQRLTEAILARGQVGWFGLIGSKTKRMQFEHRLQARGFAQERIAAMVCPVGLPGITNKAPAVIAASVCAQLLTVWEAQAASPSPGKN